MDLTYSMRLGEMPRLIEQDEAAVQKFRYDVPACPRAGLRHPEGLLARAWTCLQGQDWLQGLEGGRWEDGCHAMPLQYLGTAQAKMAFALWTTGVAVYCYSRWAGVAINTWCAGDEIQLCSLSAARDNGLALRLLGGHETL